MQHANKNLDLTHSHDLRVRGERSDIEIVQISIFLLN